MRHASRIDSAVQRAEARDDAADPGGYGDRRGNVNFYGLDFGAGVYGL